MTFGGWLYKEVRSARKAYRNAVARERKDVRDNDGQQSCDEYFYQVWAAAGARDAMNCVWAGYKEFKKRANKKQKPKR